MLKNLKQVYQFLFEGVKQNMNDAHSNIEKKAGFCSLACSPKLSFICIEKKWDVDKMSDYCEKHGEDFLEDERFITLAEFLDIPYYEIENENCFLGDIEEAHYYRVNYFNSNKNRFEDRKYILLTEDEEQEDYENYGAKRIEDIWCNGEQLFDYISDCERLHRSSYFQKEDCWEFDWDENQCIEDWINSHEGDDEFLQEWVEETFDTEDEDFEPITSYDDIDWSEVPQNAIDEICETCEDFFWDEKCRYITPDWERMAQKVFNDEGFLGFIGTYDNSFDTVTSPEEFGENSFNVYRVN